MTSEPLSEQLTDESTSEPTAAPRERIPRMLGRLWLLRRLARGGMGEVYLAATRGIEGAERPCVVKIIRRDHATDRSFIARFLDEARVQAQLQHPGVAQVVEASLDEEGEPYVVVEYVEGRSLGEVRNRAIQLSVRLSWSEAVAIGACLADALGHIHERTDPSGKALGIVHRDLSPQNVMVGYGGDLKLIDFGTARAENRRCHTISGVVFAKPGYVAPEVANGHTGDFRVDLYALGVLLWELLAGRRFLQGDTTAHLQLVARGELVPPPLATVIGAPAELDGIIARLTAHALEQRYASARQCSSDLVKLLAGSPSLPNGERGVRARIGQMMYQLYPSEPARSRAEFGSLVKAARWAQLEQSHRIGEGPKATPEKVEAAPDDSPSLVGGRYRIVRTIGEGAMGVVYEAEDTELLRLVALKVLAADHATSPDYCYHFRREARAIARLSHPNLVTLYDFGQEEDGRLFCAMELLEGETIEKLLRREQALDWRTAVGIALQVCAGLSVAHDAGVIHRDLKPANMILTDSGSVLKVLDFGIAKSEPQAVSSDSDHTTAFSLLGTPEYMAPEQLAGKAVDPRTDIYALGCVLYEMCTGALPFKASSAVAMLDCKTQAGVESLRERSPSRRVPADLDHIVLRALSPNPELRFVNARQLSLALVDALRAPGRRRQRRRNVGYVGVATVMVLGGAILAANLAKVELTHSSLPARLSASDSVLATTAVEVPFPDEARSDLGEPGEPDDTLSDLDTPTLDVSGDVSAEPGAATHAVVVGRPPSPPTSQRTSGEPRSKEMSPRAGAVRPAGSLHTPAARTTRQALSGPAAPASLPSAPGTLGPLASDRADRGAARAPLGAPVWKEQAEEPATPPASIAPIPAAPTPAVPPAAAPAASLSVPAPIAAVPVDPAALEASGAHAMARGNVDEALARYRELAESRPADAKALMSWAQSAAAAHAWEEARRAASAWVLADNSVEPRLFLARMLAYAGRMDAALAELSDLLATHPSCDEAKALLHEYQSLAPHFASEKPKGQVL